MIRRPRSISRGQLGRLDALLERGVEGTAEGDVDDPPAGRDVARPDERRDVAEAHRPHAPVDNAGPRLEPARRHVDDDAVLALHPLDDALVERPRDERDRAVAARGRVALVVKEDDAEVGAVVLRRHDVAAVHVGVPARLEDEQAAVGVEVLERETAPLEDRRAVERRDAARHDPERLAAGVVVDRLDRQ